MSGLARAGSPTPFQIVGAKGPFLFGPHGRKVIDFTAGWNVGCFGWGDPRLEAAVRKFDGPDYVGPDLEYEPWDRLAALLLEAAPGRLTKCFRATGGTEAVDIALRAAMAATGRKKFVALEGCYHGDSPSAMSLSGTDSVLSVRRIKPPLDEKALKRVETALKRRDAAAFIMEPVALSLGVLVPEKGFVAGVRRLCRKYGTLFIADEVACGFERTGRLFACEHSGLQPDLLCLGKALTGGVEGAGAVLATAGAAKALIDEGGAYSTYGWHPRAVAAALAAVGYMVKRRKTIEAHVHELGEYFRDRLLAMPFESEAEVRQLGLACAVEFEDESYAEELSERCLEEGLLVSGEEDTLSLFPPLNISRDVAERGLDILESCV